MIDGDTMVRILEDRPFTRHRARRVRTDLDVWKCRSIMRMMQKPQSFDMILLMGGALAMTLNRNPEARRILASEVVIVLNS